MKRQSGFTLIELIMVIVILGILAATALPKFVNLGSDARAAAIKAVEGSMRATNSIIYAKASIGNAMQAASSVSINGVAVTTNYGFAATVADLVKVMDITASDFDTTTSAGNPGYISHKGASDPLTCKVDYTAPATASAVPVYTPTVTGC